MRSTEMAKCLSRRSNGNWKKLKPYIVAGYYAVGLMKENKRTIYHVHRLLAETYIANPEIKPCVRLKDGVRLNISICNLEWATYSEIFKNKI